MQKKSACVPNSIPRFATTATSPEHQDATSPASPNPAAKQGAVSGASSCAPSSAGDRTFSDQLRRLAPLSSASHVGRSPPTALKRPCSHADPRRPKPQDTPGAPAPALLLGWRYQLQKNHVGVSKAILRSRNTAPPPQRRRTPARPLPKPPLETGGTRGISDQGAATGRGAPWTKHSVGLPE